MSVSFIISDVTFIHYSFFYIPCLIVFYFNVILLYFIERIDISFTDAM